MKKVFVLLLFIQVSALFPQKSEELVEEKLEIVLQEIESETQEVWDFPPFFENLIASLLKMNIIFRILFILLLAALLVFSIYKVSRLFMSERSYGSSLLPNKETREKNQINPVDYLKKALERSRNNQYDQAIIFLHRGSVLNLFDKNILTKGRDYTNREILHIINDEKISDAFYHIAKTAEFITFKGKKTDNSDFIEMEKLYRRCFL